MKIDIVHISYPPVEKRYQVMTGGDEETWAAHIAGLAQKGAKMGDCGKMCSDCAFKHPQPPTQDYYDAVDGALKVILMGGRFNCHTDDHLDAGRLCAGMEYAKQYMDSIDK